MPLSPRKWSSGSIGPNYGMVELVDVKQVILDSGKVAGRSIFRGHWSRVPGEAPLPVFVSRLDKAINVDQLAARWNKEPHPNIARLLAAVLLPQEKQYLVFEAFDGTLESFLNVQQNVGPRFMPDEILKMFVQILDGLVHLKHMEALPIIKV
jgi:serine/threonine protein kinase